MGIIIDQNPVHPRVEVKFINKEESLILVEYTYDKAIPKKVKSYLIKEHPAKKDKLIYCHGNYEIILQIKGKRLTSKIKNIMKKLNNENERKIMDINNYQWLMIKLYLKKRYTNYNSIRNILDDLE